MINSGSAGSQAVSTAPAKSATERPHPQALTEQASPAFSPFSLLRCGYALEFGLGARGLHTDRRSFSCPCVFHVSEVRSASTRDLGNQPWDRVGDPLAPCGHNLRLWAPQEFDPALRPVCARPVDVARWRDTITADLCALTVPQLRKLSREKLLAPSFEPASRAEGVFYALWHAEGPRAATDHLLQVRDDLLSRLAGSGVPS